MSYSMITWVTENLSYVAATGASIAVVAASISGLSESRKWRNEKRTDRSERHLDRKVELSIRVVAMLNEIRQKMTNVRLPRGSEDEIERAKSKLKKIDLLQSDNGERDNAIRAQIFIDRFSEIMEIRENVIELTPEIQFVLGDNVKKSVKELCAMLISIRMDAVRAVYSRSEVIPIDHLFTNFGTFYAVDEIGERINNQIQKIENECQSSVNG